MQTDSQDVKKMVFYQPQKDFRFFPLPEYYELADFNEYQGKEITTILVAKIHEAQVKFISKALMKVNCWMSFNDSQNQNIQWILTNFNAYYNEIMNGVFIKETDKFLSTQENLYELIHSTCLCDYDKLAFEFILGLARFDIALQLILKFVKDNKCYTGYLSPKRCDEISEIFNKSRNAIFFDRLSIIAEVGEELIAAIIAVTNAVNDRYYWETVTEFFKKNNNIYKLSTHLVSIQYIPNNSRFLTIAQVLHWNGLGGNANILKNFAALEAVTVHAVQYHSLAQQQNFDDRREIFKKRREIFKNAQKNIMSYVTRVVTNTLSLSVTKNIRIYDVCSGPQYEACKDIFSNFPDYKFQLTLSDIDGGSLAHVHDTKLKNKQLSNVIVEHIYYEDMNLALPEIKHEPYHLVMAGFGLHQIDKDRIPYVLKKLSMRLKPGGLLLNPDVGNNSASQLFLIPANIVDREGSVDGYEKFKLEDLINEELNGPFARITYPLHRVCSSHTNNCWLQNESGPYMFNIFIALDFPKEHLNELCKKWKSNKEDCDEFVSKLLPINLIDLQTTMLQLKQSAKTPKANL